MPKPVYATLDDFDDFQAKIDDRLAKQVKESQALEKRLQEAITVVANNLNQKDGEQRDRVDAALSESKTYTDEGLENMHKQVTQTSRGLQNQMEQAKAEIEASVKKTSDAAKAALKETVEKLCVENDQHAEETKADYVDRISETADDAERNLQNQRKEIEAMIRELHSRCDKQEHSASEAEGAVAGAFAKVEKLGQEQTAIRRLVETDVFAKLDLHDRQLKEVADVAEANLKTVEKTLRAEIQALDEDTKTRFRDIAIEIEKIRNAVGEVENLNTRRVDWIMRGASRQFRPNSANKGFQHRSWFSPKFNMAGLHGLQLELQLFRPSDPPTPGEKVGDAAVFLWACKGMHVTFRLFIGSKYQTLEKIFNGRVPYGTQRLCFVKDQINMADDTLRIGVEVLECYRDVEHVIEEQPKLFEDIRLPSTATQARAPEGVVLYHRHVNNKLLDQVKHHVECLQARSIKKVEWRIEKASQLPVCFPPGECICSSHFSVAGLEGLQLVFYPSGYRGALDGFCSLFLYGPAGCTIKCWLCLGVQRREARHTFEEAGAFGRTNYTRFDTIVDENDDTVLVTLEIVEAQQGLIAQGVHPAKGGPPSGFQSIVKLQATPGKAADGLDDVRVLPSLWTTAFRGKIDKAGDDLHSFDELESLARSTQLSGGQSTSMASTRTDLQGRRSMKFSGSMPSLTGKTWRGQGPSDAEGQPPSMAATVGGFEAGGIPAKRAGRSRRDNTPVMLMGKAS
mmetsp:Transcript_122422/g.346092  ORF Transcript_122422/g.346092 Transcript_122422/m.346092 type:complete len:738 (-) Transcript_122422:382-2595(-)